MGFCERSSQYNSLLAMVQHDVPSLHWITTSAAWVGTHSNPPLTRCISYVGVHIANVSVKKTTYFYLTPFNKSAAQRVKIKRLQRINWALTLQDLTLWKVLLMLLQKKCLFYCHKGNAFSPSPFLFYKRLSKMKGVRLCFFFLAWSRMYGWGMTDVCNQLQWSMLKFQSNPLISLQSRKPKQMGSALHYKNTAALLCCIM